MLLRRLTLPIVILALGCSSTTTTDSGPGDAGEVHADDRVSIDTGSPDTGGPDTGAPDTGSPDTGSPDTGVADGGLPDAGGADVASDLPVAPDGGTCAVTGTYRLITSEWTMYFRLRPDGTWVAAMSLPGLEGSGDAGGTWSESGGRFLIHDRSSSGSCPTTSEGVYAFVHGPACASLTLTLVTDPCGERGMVLNGAVFTRVS